MSTQNFSRLSAVNRQFLARQHGHFIDGKWQHDSTTLPVLDPSNGQAISTIARAGEAQIDAAVHAAHRAMHAPDWRGLSPLMRERLLLALADKMDANTERLAELESLDTGMPIGFAKLNVMGAAGVFRYMAGWASKIGGHTFDVKMPIPNSQFFACTLKEPVGVVAAIVPWNVPLMMAAWKLAPALAAGCAVVFKPAEDACLTALTLADLIAETAFPAGAINVVTGTGSEAGEALVKHPLVSKITFTGSTRTGQHINRLASDTVKRVTLELGGKSPSIVFDDADIDAAIVGAANAIFTHAGQICVAGSRLYVQRRVFEQVAEGVARHADALTIGAGLDPSAQLGPLINARQQMRVQGYIQRARASGATALTRRNAIPDQGFFVAPTVFAGVQQHDALVQEEIFGPVLAVLPFDELDEVAALANDCAYGLAACVWSNDLRRIHQLLPQLECGKVSINTEGFPYPALPEGGTKASGFGRDLGFESLQGYLNTKSVLMKVA